METQGGLLEPILKENCDNVCYLYQYMLYFVFVIRGISLVDTKTAIFVTNRYRSNSIVF